MTELSTEGRAAILAAAEQLEGMGETLKAGQRASWGTYGEVPGRDVAAVDADLLDLAERVDALASAIAAALRGESL